MKTTNVTALGSAMRRRSKQITAALCAAIVFSTVCVTSASAEKKKMPKPSPTPTATATPAPVVEATPEANFSFDKVIERAERLSKEPYDDNAQKISGEWLKISYDDQRNIRFRPQYAFLKGKSNFEVQFFHPGFIFDRTVGFNIVENDVATEVPFDSSWFHYEWGDKPVPPIPSNMHYAGFRVHYPLHSQEYKDEILVFLGASYFKFLGRKQKYGISARGLAIDTAEPRPEEFPLFRQFWMYRPTMESDTITVFAFMDSPSITGAYSFVLRPGTNSVVDVRAVLFPRKEIGKMGIAPLTSMFLYGENRTRNFDDFRPEVHDSDGLLLHTGGGEWVWRPLVNRERLNIAYYGDTNPLGFGLMQRDRNFENYQDLEAFYQERPSYWVEPIGQWGKGHLELVELPTNSETNDNIVAYWVPEKRPVPGERFEFSYRITSLLKDDKLSPRANAIATRFSSAQRPGSDDKEKLLGRLFVIDFAGRDFDYLDAAQPVEGVVWSSSGTINNVIAHKNDNTGGWRLTFDFFPEKGKTYADFRGYLKLGDKALTETWTYLWTPEPAK